MPKPVSHKPRRHRHDRSAVWPLLTLLLASFGVVIFVAALMFYRVPNASPDIRTMARLLHVPVATVGGDIVTAADTEAQRNALVAFARYQEKQAPGIFQTPSASQLDQIVLDRQIRSAFTEQLARKHNLRVTDADVTKDFSSKVQAANIENIAQQLREEFGLSVEEYQNLIVRPFLLTEKLEAIVAQDPAVAAALDARLAIVRDALAQSTEPFEKLVALYSDDAEAATNGGDLGYKRKGELPDEVFTAAQTLEAGKRSEPIKAADGYHIIELLESVPPAEDGTPVIHIRELLIRRTTVDAWITSQIQKKRVAVLVPWLRWDANTAQVLEK